jgi:nitroreductase
MHTRREFIKKAAVALGLASGNLSACSPGRNDEEYAKAVRVTWGASLGIPANVRAAGVEMVRYATLAASSHNTQPWKFRLEDERISILPDLSRRCPVVDPDDHHLFVSLGCAAENLLLAARALGQYGSARFNPSVGDILDVPTVDLEPAKPAISPLFAAISERQCTRAEYDGKNVPGDELKLLEQAGRGDGVNLLLLTDRAEIEQVLQYVAESNKAQLDDPRFAEELQTWIRFSDEEALERNDGLSARASGNPVVSRWLGRLMFRFFVTAQGENEKYARHIRSSPAIAVFVADANDKAHWFEAGRCYQRFALQATALGLRNAFINQPVEVAALRTQFASYLGIGERRPNLVVRLGYGPEMPRSLRRPVEEVLV